MRVLVIEPDSSETAGAVGEALTARGADLEPLVIQVDPADPYAEVEFPDHSDYDLVVAMGSTWSVYDPQVVSWVKPELVFLEQAVAANTPVLGICFGAQALSAALGGVVEKAPRLEAGWRQVETDIEALRGPWFQLHFDRFTVPPGATELARSDVGPQAFRINRALAVQFHAEITVEHLLMWYESGDWHRIGVDTDQLLTETRQHAPAARLRVERLVDFFLGDIAG